MSVLSFLLDICPFVGGIKMMIESGFKKDLTGIELHGKARGIHFLFGIISLIADFFTAGLLGSFGRGLFKLLGKGFLRRAAVVGARKAGRGTVARTALRGAGRTLGRMQKTAIGKAVLRGAEGHVKNKFDVNKYRRNEGNYREEVRGNNQPNTRQEILDKQRLENPKNEHNGIQN